MACCWKLVKIRRLSTGEHIERTHTMVFEFHRLLAKRFPYAVYYKVVDETCIVFRALDCRQEPAKPMEELK